MKWKMYATFVAVLWFCGMSAPAAEQPRVEIKDLRCEYLNAPLGIDVPRPRLSWVIESSRRGERQSAYQVLVASNSKLLAEDKGDLWDSGKVMSDRSIQIEYGGKELVSRQECHWKVRVWDKDGAPTAWSRPVFWKMGLLKPEDWTAKWIAVKAKGLPHPWFRRTFEVKPGLARALVYVNTPSIYELYINGQKVGDDVLTPATVNIRKRFFYNVYDVASYLKPGRNCIALWIGPGWYRHAPIFRAQLEMESADGRVVIDSDGQWRGADSCISQLGSWSWGNFGGERWDAAKYLKDWNQAAFDDSAWAAAVITRTPAVATTWQDLPGSRMRAPIPAKKIYPHKDKWVVDFGTTLTGWMRLRLKGLKPGQEIQIDYADLDNPKLAFGANKDGFQTFNQRDAYVAGSETQDVFCSRFNQHAFRYAVIAGLTQAPELSDAEAMTVETDLEKTGEFTCSNDLFNQIHQVTVQTYHTQIPCGVLGGGEAREKLGYGDGGSFLTGMLYNLRSDAFFKKWLRDWCDGQRDSGFLGHTAPEFIAAGGGPSWGGQASELVRRLYLYFGDRQTVADSYATLKKYLDHLESNTKDDILVYYNPYEPGKFQRWYFLGDWTPPKIGRAPGGFLFETPQQQEFFNNCYRILLWDQLATYAGVLGDQAEVDRCRQRLAVLRPLIHNHFYDVEKKTYKSNRQAYLTIALLAGIVPQELRPAIFKQLEDDIVIAKKGHLDTGMQGSFMLLDLLTREGRPDLVALMMNQTTYPGWGYLIKECHVTSWPETWSGWGSQVIQVVGTPGAWFYEGLAGIQPDPAAPGFKHFLIRPGMVDSVNWVRCHYDSPYGRIVSNWKREGQELQMDVTVPVNTTATVYIPAKDAATVSESNKPAAQADGIKFLKMDHGAAVYEVGSGSYRFRSQM